MLILSKNEIKKIFSMQDAIYASKQALAAYSKGKCLTPLRLNLNIQKANGQTLIMPAHVPHIHATGIKIASVYPDNIKQNKPSILAQMLLIDSRNGEVIAIMDGTYLTQLRTGALQGAATDLLAKKTARTAMLIGTGGQAATQLEAMLTVRKLTEVKVYDVDFSRAQQFVIKMQDELKHFAAKLIAIKNVDEHIASADIITAVTTSKTPVFDGDLVKNGAHINGIGAYTKDMQEIPLSAIMKANKIYFDNNEGVLHEAGDIMHALKSGKINQENFNGELGELVIANKIGRENEDEITFFKAVGMAVLDVVTAQQIYEKAIINGIGQTINLD